MTKGLKYINKNQFILSSESKRLYKQFMNLTRQIEDKAERKSLRFWIRDDFKLNKNVTEELDIKSLHIRARRALEDLDKTINLSQSRNGESSREV